jgi:hypothetical protein
MAIHVPRSFVGGCPLPGDLRRTLERSWDTDLPAARVHSGAHVDAALSDRGVVGAASGNDILVSSALQEERLSRPVWKFTVAAVRM